MTANNRKHVIAALVLSFFAVHPSFPQSVKSQEADRIRLIRENFVVVPAYHKCYPVEVKGIVLTGDPLDVLLAQVIVENHSAKSVTAVKLGWRVHAFSRTVKPDLACGVPPTDKVLLAGVTPRIDLGQLAPKETSNIGPNPLINPQIPATKTVFIYKPILTANDVQTLPLAETRRTVKYSVAMYVSEIQFSDGTTWIFNSN
jgi:hypothetical protein